jgi:hypothetical protein
MNTSADRTAGSSRRESPAPAQSATVSTRCSARPATRMPEAVGGSTSRSRVARATSGRGSASRPTTGLDDVRVGVGGDERAAAPHETGDHRALGRVFGDRARAPEQERVVHEEEIGAQAERLVDGVEHGVDGQVHVGHGPLGITDGQPRGVP